MKHLYLIALFLMGLMLSACSREEPAVVAPAPPPVVYVKINEIYSAGTTTNPDWIEIYNPTAASIDLSGYAIYNIDGKNNVKPKKQFPAGTTIPAMGRVTITVDTADASGFGLSSTGETIWLEDGTGKVIDNVTFPAIGVDSSYGRKPDGSTSWQVLSPATKGITNGGTVNLQPLVMNEIYSRGTANVEGDWIEIYNPNDIGVDLTGYKIYDVGGTTTKPKKEFPAGSVIPAKGFYVITTDTTLFTGDLTGFGLSSGGEKVWFEAPSGSVLDSLEFPAMGLTQSYSRIPDGSINWQLAETITRGKTNKP